MSADCAALIAAFPDIAQWITTPASCCGAKRTFLNTEERIVVCDSNGRITQIFCRAESVASNGVRITGTLAPLQALDKLTQLEVSENHITGSIPAGLVQLTSLQSLSLSGNLLSGSIPTLSQSITFLNLARLNLTGRLPATLPPALQEIDISYSGLSGPIPTAWSQVQTLHGIYMINLPLSGSIPTEFGLLKSLGLLHLGNTGLVGGIPSELGALTSLTSLDLSNNSLTGPLPTAFSTKTWFRLDVFNNTLTGEVPPSLWENSRFSGDANCFTARLQSARCASLNTQDRSGEGQGVRVTQWILITAAVAVFALACVLGVYIYRKKKRPQQPTPPTQQQKDDTQTATHVVANILDEDDQQPSLTQPDSNLSDGTVSVLHGGEKDATTTIASLPSNAVKVSLFDVIYTDTIPHTTIETYPKTTPDYKKQETPSQPARDLQSVHPTRWTVNDVGVWCAAQLPDLEVQIVARVVDRDINGSRLVTMRRNDFSEQLGLVFADAVVLEDAVDAVVQRHLNLTLPSYEQSG
ncbi:hypothetical protein BJ741DRAFT_613659 [Chytriomyces cf. hyalinus JEL632]|nr:hypothetical protein BJ741DRAFT_613659 [Chytriomyces cf. hyalinus JEL632]